MPLYVINCADRPGALQLRLDTRPAHLAYLQALGRSLMMAGPFLDSSGNPNGSMIVAEFEDEAAARAFADADPYALAGLFSSVTVSVWRKVFPPE